MSYFDFDLDIDAAKSVDASSGLTGAFKGTVIKAFAFTSSNRTQGVAVVVDIPGMKFPQRTDFYTHKEDGSKAYGYSQIQSLLVILGLKRLRGAEGKYSLYDRESQEEVTHSGTIFPDFLGKEVGVVIQRQYDDYGGDKPKYRIVKFFRAHDDMLTSEILEGAREARGLAKYLSTLKDLDKRTNRRTSAVEDEITF